MTHKPLPWSETCFVCGDKNPRGLDGKFEVDEEGRVRLATTVAHDFEGYGGHVHGGVVTALLDETAGWAATVALRRMCMTIQITVTFRRPVPGGTPIEVVGEYLGKVGRFHGGRAEMRDGEGRVLATAEGRFRPVSENLHEEVLGLLKMPGRPARPEDI
jgi:uncharacterized protein (TIGR00369 family)